MRAAAPPPALAEAPDHPRRTPTLIGQEVAEAELLAAWDRGRLGHAWLIGGPKGIGKATLAFRFARFVLAEGRPRRDTAAEVGLFGPATGLRDGAVPHPVHAPSHPLFQRVASGGHADLLVIERQLNDKTGRLRAEIGVEEVRRLGDFFAKTAAEDGWRIAIVDAVDEMSRSAANALLKILEEPPPRALLLLIAHAPAQALPTIRSRCRRLVCRPLTPEQVMEIVNLRIPGLDPAEGHDLVRLADGSPGRALALAGQGGIGIHHDLLALLDLLPSLDAARLHAFADQMVQDKSEAGFDLALDLLARFVAALIRRAAAGAASLDPGGGTGEGRGEARLIARLATAAGPGGGLDRWLDVWEKVNQLRERADAVNLDRKGVLLGIFFALARAA